MTAHKCFPWQTVELDHLRVVYRSTPAKRIAQDWIWQPRRSPQAIANKARLMGLRKHKGPPLRGFYYTKSALWAARSEAQRYTRRAIDEARAEVEAAGGHRYEQ